MAEEASRPLADAVRSPSLDGIWLVPRISSDPHETIRLVAGVLGRRPHRGSRGIELSATDGALVKASAVADRIAWCEEVERFLANRNSVATFYEKAVAEIRAIALAGREAALKRLSWGGNYEQLDDHQVINVAAMTLGYSPGLCLFDEQGAGKTVSMIYAFDELVRRNEADFLLIVAPKSMVGEWPKDFLRFTGDLYKIAAATGSLSDKRRILRQRPDVLITNFETAISMERELEAHLRSYEGRAVVAVDESFFIKSAEAKRTLSLRRLREWCTRAYVLCGTPAPNAPSDLVEQFNMVDFGLTFDGIDIPDDRDQALPVVQGVIEVRGLYLRSLKSDVLPNLPSKAFQRLRVPLQPVQAELYRRGLQALNDELVQMDDAQFKRQITNYLAQRSALLQLCSDPAAVVQTYTETPAKLLALDDLLHRLIGEQSEKVIVWSFYTRMIDRLMARYAGYGATRYDGKVADVQERRESVRRFQEDPETKLFIANPAAAGAGLTLHSARYAVYESMSNQAAHYLQSLDRIHRRGQKRNVTYFVLTCEGTIEEPEYDRLVRKEQAAQALLHDEVGAPVVRTAALEETLQLLAAIRVAPQDG